MSLWRDENYLRQVSVQLERFHDKGGHVYQFRCPLCGDSEVKKSKARGYIFPKGQLLMFKCHNCSVAMPFSALLKRLSRRLYDEYILERLKEDQPREHVSTFAPKASTGEPDDAPRGFAETTHAFPLLSVAEQPASPLHEVYRYAKERQIPDSGLARLFGTVEAYTWIRHLVGDEKAAKVEDGLPYLIQPLRMPDGMWYGAQLRMLTRKEYLTFRWANDPLKIFGLDAWNPDKLTYVVEGPIDSLFVPNCISPCGSDLMEGMRHLEDKLAPVKRRVFVWDNEPRNREVVKHIRAAIKLREPVVIWPREYPKDINDMVRAGIDVNAVIPKRTFAGLAAELEFSSWLKN